MEAPLSDAEAAVRVRQGDQSAYSTLVRNHQESAFRTAFLILRDTAAAEDVAQEAFIRAYRHFGRFRETEPFRPWLLRIVTNLALNDQRSRTRKRSVIDRMLRLQPPIEDSGAKLGIDAALIAGEEATLLWQAMERLNQADRLILYLRYFLELDQQEMAGVIGKRPGTVKSRLNRASQRLRELIEREYPDLKAPNEP